MKFWTISDLHVDYADNFKWVENLSTNDFQDDVLLVAGDVAEDLILLNKTFRLLSTRFSRVFYIPGNHDLWVRRYEGMTSFDKLTLIQKIAADNDVTMQPDHIAKVHIVPLYSWYDYSFGTPTAKLNSLWRDLTACVWPPDFTEYHITRTFAEMNEKALDKHIKTHPNNTASSHQKKASTDMNTDVTISFSHFVPRLDLMPDRIPERYRIIYPFLGSSIIHDQIKRLGSNIHIYGHSHVNQHTYRDHVLYINNAFGYPHEKSITAKQLKCVFESSVH